MTIFILRKFQKPEEVISAQGLYRFLGNLNHMIGKQGDKDAFMDSFWGGGFHIEIKKEGESLEEINPADFIIGAYYAAHRDNDHLMKIRMAEWFNPGPLLTIKRFLRDEEYEQAREVFNFLNVEDYG